MSANWWAMTWLVARREINDRGRAKSFWIASAVLLVAVAVGAIIPALLAGSHATARIGIVGGPAAALSQTAREAGRLSGTSVTVVALPGVAAAEAGLRSGKLAAALVGDTEVLVNRQPVTGSSIGTTLAQIGGLQKIYAQLPPAAAAGVAARGIALPVHSLSPPTKNLATRITGLTAAILIYVIILTYGIRITIGVGEEKATRVVEVLLTTLRPVQLLAGKVIGMGLLALGQIAAMVAVYLVLGHAVGSPEVRGAATSIVLVGGLWIVLGYAFYCTAYAAAGSLISRTADAYNAALPLQIPLILAYVLTYTVIYASTVNPFFHVLAFIPFTAPVAMPVLVAVGAAPAWQVAVSAVITVASTVWMARLAGTIYGRAILRTGSRLKVRQVLRSAA
ncbi:MAG TPA: ABC transporter permease [Streptosporangiaceae bacterium]|nr:ABC transporter permease [Streptosporangiaceae bacterium]